MNDERLAYYLEQVMQDDVLERLPSDVVTPLHLLQRRVEELEEEANRLTHQAGLDNRTSSKPPSTDRSRRGRRRRSTRKRSGKHPEGQEGHPGITLEPSDTPAHIVRHSVSTCEQWGGDVSEVKAECVQTRQVFDLPPVILEVTEYQAETKTCPQCQHSTTASFPPDIASRTQHGERLKGLLVCCRSFRARRYMIKGEKSPGSSAYICVWHTGLHV